jgi:UDP-N-acetylmuramoyl-tripeptide--D-alanyl-D-alanine ligase
MLIALLLLAVGFAGWRMGRRLRFFLHLLQLEGYKTRGYKKWLGARLGDVVFRVSHGLGLVLLALGFAAYTLGWGRFWLGAVLLGWAVSFASSRRYRSEREKKPLNYTSRLKRLLATALALASVVVALGGILGALGFEGAWWMLGLLAGFWLADLGMPLWVSTAAAFMKPVERGVQEGYKRQAREKLAARPDLKIVAITGSYGKTSTKFIVAEILKQRYNTLATPGSYNTPMGVCLVVNNKLKPEHQVLVLEMGIRHKGDIAELCEVATPGAAIETSVGVAHLETMGSIDAIEEEKGSLLDFTREGGPVVLNADDERVRRMDRRARGPVWLASAEGREDAHIAARDLSYGPEGATFTVVDRSGEVEGGAPGWTDEPETATFTTKLLGLHNVQNLLLGVAMGRALGLRLRQIAHAAGRIEPVAHRLALRHEGGITVIDDAFNSNPVGAKNAVEVLGQFTTGKRIIVTPGMIELGEREADENRAFGRHIAANADLAILVGPTQAKWIREGLLDAGFPEAQIYMAKGLFAAQEHLRQVQRPGDVVLYENDLPDQLEDG